ncbi:hypothetical protein CPB84DRAFT_1779995 [Gymnopilus junonius]|uniref:F-box domain-containing protein n=1 Tax=Gymnopilus junonius TaxID=109634 RepID=A0A9P5NN19_GYMJU|nr:hypothetical protein CPB84DRAFT_1779995 [Gymnopilus junonius]
MTSLPLAQSGNDPTVIRFTHLPLDIHNLILELLSPSDIIALRKTCRTMVDATSQRLLWLKLVERMCQDNTVYRHSFPTDDMSVLELEYATMSPKKWESLALKSESLEEELPSFATNIIRPEYFSNDAEPEDLYLVPGGRFLIILQRGYLYLWDLGYISAIGSARSEMKEIARIQTDCSSYTVHASPDGSALRILAVSYEPEAFTKYDYDVLEIFPWKPSPQFTLIASLSVTSSYDLDFTSVCGDKLTLVYGPLIKIWDFKEDEWATWNTNGEHRQILMTKETIVLIDEHNLSVWDVPKLVKDATARSAGEPTVQPSKPRCTLNYTNGYRPFTGYICKGLCDWYTGSPQPLWYDLLNTSNGYSYHFDRFEADVSDLQSLDIPIKSLPSFQLPNTGIYGAFILPYRACGQSIIVPWGNTRGMRCHIGSTTPGDTRDHNVTLRLVDRISPRCVSFCPVSGRLVYISPFEDQIEVVDYLWPTDVPQGVDQQVGIPNQPKDKQERTSDTITTPTEVDG